MSSSKEISAKIMEEIVAAMHEAEYMAMGDMQEGTEVFYGGGQPKVYERTGQLGTTPRTSGVKTSGKSVSFDAYLSQEGKYSTGKHPSMGTVLELANYGNVSGYKDTVGTKGFWEYSEGLIEESFHRALASRFD